MRDENRTRQFNSNSKAKSAVICKRKHNGNNRMYQTAYNKSVAITRHRLHVHLGGKEMNKQIMLSVRPQWVEMILSGKKTVEIRKKIPKCNLPIDVNIYVTKEKQNERRMYDSYSRILNGKVVAKFTLNKFEELEYYHFLNQGEYGYRTDNPDWLKNSYLTFEELFKYLGMKNGYAWHIDNLKVFDEPRELSEVYRWNKWYGDMVDIKKGQYIIDYCKITKAPQSFMYCYDSKEIER